MLDAQRDGQNHFAPDGAIAWTGLVDQDPERLHAVYHSVSGPGAWNVGACGMMEVGTVRFLADGSFLLVPGVEPDVVHFSAKGKLLETWTSEAVGFEAECDISDEQMYKLSVDEPGRWAWVDARPWEMAPGSSGCATSLHECARSFCTPLPGSVFLRPGASSTPAASRPYRFRASARFRPDLTDVVFLTSTEPTGTVNWSERTI